MPTKQLSSLQDQTYKIKCPYTGEPTQKILLIDEEGLSEDNDHHDSCFITMNIAEVRAFQLKGNDKLKTLKL